MVSYQINVYGRVQGVGFRWFTQQAAERHHISGWVRNKTDGSVEMAIQGEPAAIDRFLAIIAAGLVPIVTSHSSLKRRLRRLKGKTLPLGRNYWYNGYL